MKRDALENIVLDAMTNVEVALNTDEIWHGVEQKLYPKKKKRFGWFLWGFALMALIALAVVLPKYQSHDPAIASSDTATKTNTSTMSLNSASVSDKEAEAQLANPKQLASNNDVVSSTQIKEPNVLEAKSKIKQVKSTFGTVKSSTELSTIDKTIETKNNAINNSNTNEKPQVGSNLLVKTQKSSAIVNNDGSDDALNADESMINTSTTFKTDAIDNNSRESIDVPILRRPIPELKMINIKTVWAIVLPIMNEVEKLFKKSIKTPKTNKIANTSIWAWHMDLFMGIDKPYRALTGEDSKLLELRNNSETVLEGWHANLSTGIQHRSGFYTDFGLSISNITEAVDVNTRRVYDQIGDVETNDKDKSGQFSTGKTTGNNIYLETTEGTVYSKHTYYSIPVALGYELPFNKWSVAGEFGTEINLLKNSKGHILDANNELISFNTTEGNSQIFLKRVGLNWNAKLKFAYKIRENQSLYLSPYMLMSNKSITNNQYALKQNYNRYGIALGYRISL